MSFSPAPQDVAAGGVRVTARRVEEEVGQVAPLDVLLLGRHVREVQLIEIRRAAVRSGESWRGGRVRLVLCGHADTSYVVRRL